MTTRTRTNKKTNIHLESLEAREAPTVGLAGAWQAALAQAQGHSLRGVGFQRVQRALPIARPGSTFQGPAANPGAAVNASFSASRTPIRPMLALAQARRAAMNSMTPTLNRAQFLRPALAARLAMRTPPTVSATPTTPVTPVTPPISTNANPTAADATPLPANVSGALNAIYQEYQKSSTVPVSDAPGAIVTDGSNVGVNVHGNGQGSFADFVGTLQNLGMQITASSDVYWTVSGMLPISQLPTTAQTPQTLSITPMYKPITSGWGAFLS